MRIAFYAGSFDPPTNGHIDIIERGLLMFDRLVIGVGVHATKMPLFDFSTRADLLRHASPELEAEYGDRLEIVEFDGLVVVAARDFGAQYILRSLRDSGDFEYESSMTAMNHVMAPSIETVFLVARPDYNFISSTLVRQIASMGGDVAGFVPRVSVDALAQKFRVNEGR